MPGQLFGGPEGGQRVGVTAARQLEQPADVVDRHRIRWPGFRPNRALGALDPGLRLIRPRLRDERAREHHVGDADGRVVGPAVPFGQLDRLPAALGRPRKRPEDLDRCLVRQAGEFQIGPPDPAGQRDAVL
jgi:hypothetical protein